MTIKPCELSFLSRGMTISCKAWGEKNKPVILSLHGWLDNAASFDQLAPLLASEFHVLCLDLPGQGKSDKRRECSTYHLWDDMVDVKSIIDSLAPDKVSLLGHSRGAMLSLMLASAFPEKISQLFLVDGLVPLPEKLENTPQQLRQYVSDFLKQPEKRRFNTRADAISIRAKVGRIEESLAEMLAARQLKQDDLGWYWDVDDRLRHASAVKMTDHHNDVLLDSLVCPVKVFLAEQGMGSYPKMQQYREQYNQFEWSLIPGHHHLHMTLAGAKAIANKILGNASY